MYKSILLFVAVVVAAGMLLYRAEQRGEVIMDPNKARAVLHA